MSRKTRKANAAARQSANSRYTRRKPKAQRKGEKEVDDLRLDNKAKVAKQTKDRRRFADIERRVQERIEGKIP